MTPADFQFLAGLMKRRSGIAFAANKASLFESRLAPLAERHGFVNLADLVRELAKGSEPLARETVDAMTTNESWFFRDKLPFDCFRDTILPALCKARARERRIRIWCAGAAMGQEPYSLAMILEDRKAELAGWTIEIFATDINAEVIGRAKEGLYHPFEVQRGLPVPMLARHFRREGENWRLSQAIRKAVQFRVFNLLESFAGFGPFDIIFCRNVLIYFDTASKTEIVGRFSTVLANDGYLVLGVAETVLGLGSAFEPLPDARGVYLKAEGMGARGLAALAG